MTNAVEKMMAPKTIYMTKRAPNLSDIHPPTARIIPDGKLKIAAIMPAVTTDMVYTFT